MRAAANFINALAVTTLFALANASVLVAQTSSMRVTVPAPTAASLGKFGDVPVSLYTGTPDISVPIFTVKVSVRPAHGG